MPQHCQVLRPAPAAKETRPHNRICLTTRCATRYRDRAILITLLDTGLRSSELCALLRSGVDVIILQALLGHYSLDVVQHHTKIDEVGVENAQRNPSPADNWHL